MTLQVKPMTGGLGAEILGADVRDAAQFDVRRPVLPPHALVELVEGVFRVVDGDQATGFSTQDLRQISDPMEPPAPDTSTTLFRRAPWAADRSNSTSGRPSST